MTRLVLDYFQLATPDAKDQILGSSAMKEAFEAVEEKRRPTILGTSPFWWVAADWLGPLRSP